MPASFGVGPREKDLSDQQSAISGQLLLAVNCQPLVMGYSLLTASDGPLASVFRYLL
jgi:hypothetical protein